MNDKVHGPPESRRAALERPFKDPPPYYWREGDPPSTWVHRVCGALIADRAVHEAWHARKPLCGECGHLWWDHRAGAPFLVCTSRGCGCTTYWPSPAG